MRFCFAALLAGLAVPALGQAIPQPTPTAAPVVKAGTGQTRTLADVARERKLGIKGVPGGTLSVTGAQQDAESYKARTLELSAAAKTMNSAADAQGQLLSAVQNYAWVQQNIHYNEAIKADARQQWDAAAEACRHTADCTPRYRDDLESDARVAAKRAYQQSLHEPGALSK